MWLLQYLAEQHVVDSPVAVPGLEAIVVYFVVCVLVAGYQDLIRPRQDFQPHWLRNPLRQIHHLGLVRFDFDSHHNGRWQY